MTYKNFVLALSFLFIASASAQQKKLSLEDGVMQQNRLFRADKMLGFQWLPNSTKYIYLADSGKKLLTATAVDSKTSELITLSDFNKAAGTDVKTFFGIDWKDANTFILANGNKYYEYNTQTKTGRLLTDLGESAGDATFDSSKSNIAFTEKNNLFFLDNNKQKVAITNESNENIVSGQFFARNEFGISNGIFWSPKSNFIAFYQKIIEATPRQSSFR